MSPIPLVVRARLERAKRWHPGSLDIWWTTPVLRYDGRRPCEMAAWELEELIRKLEDGPQGRASVAASR
jgi:hypothetical protein